MGRNEAFGGLPTYRQEPRRFIYRVSSDRNSAIENEAAERGIIPGATVKLLDGTVRVVESIKGGRVFVQGQKQPIGIGAVESVIAPPSASNPE